jgi:hypothetical protein
MAIITLEPYEILLLTQPCTKTLLTTEMLGDHFNTFKLASAQTVFANVNLDYFEVVAIVNKYGQDYKEIAKLLRLNSDVEHAEVQAFFNDFFPQNVKQPKYTGYAKTIFVVKNYSDTGNKDDSVYIGTLRGGEKVYCKKDMLISGLSLYKTKEGESNSVIKLFDFLATTNTKLEKDLALEDVFESFALPLQRWGAILRIAKAYYALNVASYEVRKLTAAMQSGVILTALSQEQSHLLENLWRIINKQKTISINSTAPER